MTEIDNWGEPTDAAKQKDAEIEHLKLEMDGVDNAKEEIGRLLGLTEEFRWKRISAAIHEQKRLIRELLAQAPVSAVPGWSVTVRESDERTWLRLKSSQGQEAVLSCKTKHDNGETLVSQVVKAFAASFASPPPPAQADDNALIRELVAALGEFLEFGEYAYSHGREALAKAKAQGYEP